MKRDWFGEDQITAVLNGADAGVKVLELVRRLGIWPIVGIVILLSVGTSMATTIPAFAVTGRVAVSEPHSCDGGGGDPTQNLVLSWSSCHDLKQHMDAAGNRITTNAFVATALRPLTLTVDIQVYCYYNGGAISDGLPRRTVSVQTNDAGKFRARIPATTCGLAKRADGVSVVTTARLSYEMRSGTAVLGTVRALWDKALGQTVYNSVLSASEPALYSGYGYNWVIPRFVLNFRNLNFPLPSTLNLGNQTFFDGAAAYYYDYVRGALGTWQTIIALHKKLSNTLAADGFGLLYKKIFINDANAACNQCYTLAFDNTQGGGVGGRGGFSIDQPANPVSNLTYRGLVSVGLPAHEFGHSIHATIASRSFSQYAYDPSMFWTQDSQGMITQTRTTYQWRGTTPPDNVLQQQELGIAFTEGFGDAMGAFFLTGCKINDRAWGDPDALHNMWNPGSYQQCDSTAGCPYGAFRHQMSRRNIGENSATWNARILALTDLAQQAAAAGAIMVLSNNELKVRNFICDLLDDDPDVSFAAGKIGGKTYIADFMWNAAERLDGRTPTVTFNTYVADPTPEQVKISLGMLLTAMDGFTPILNSIPAPVAPPFWQSSATTDGANRPYNDTRISVNGVLSPQKLGSFMVNSGYLTKDELNNILRSNRMDEMP